MRGKVSRAAWPRNLAVVYLCTSADRSQTAGMATSLTTQRDGCEYTAVQKNLRIIAQYADVLTSNEPGPLDLPGLELLRHSLENPVYDFLIVESISRLGTNRSDVAEMLARLEFEGVQVITVLDEAVPADLTGQVRTVLKRMSDALLERSSA
jgi:DNA invertase Pin-like site-specific DNA recombinase